MIVLIEGNYIDTKYIISIGNIYVRTDKWRNEIAEYNIITVNKNTVTIKVGGGIKEIFLLVK